MALRYHLLLVEDDEPTREIVSELICKIIPAEFKCASTNEEAIAIVAEKQPDLIISDIYRPGGHGTELLAELRSCDETSNIPFILVSGNLERALRSPDWLRFGVDAALSKPFEVDELARAINLALRRRSDPDDALLDVGTETATLDYKENVVLGDRKSVASLAKDVVAMANIGGGSIVVGIRDRGNGFFEQIGLAENELRSLETTRLNDALRPYAGDALAVTPRVLNRAGKMFIVIKVPPAKGCPAMANKNHEGAALFKGRLYYRTDAGRSEEAQDNAVFKWLIEQAQRRGRDQV